MFVADAARLAFYASVIADDWMLGPLVAAVGAAVLMAAAVGVFRLSTPASSE